MQILIFTTKSDRSRSHASLQGGGVNIVGHIIDNLYLYTAKHHKQAEKNSVKDHICSIIKVLLYRVHCIFTLPDILLSIILYGLKCSPPHCKFAWLRLHVSLHPFLVVAILILLRHGSIECILACLHTCDFWDRRYKCCSFEWYATRPNAIAGQQ